MSRDKNRMPYTRRRTTSRRAPARRRAPVRRAPVRRYRRRAAPVSKEGTFRREFVGAIGRNLGLAAGAKIGAGIGSIAGPVGTFLGGIGGAALGRVAGGLAGGGLGHVLGMGDYTVQHNVLVAGDQVPSFGSAADRETVVYHREFITDITTSGTTGAFKIDTFPINPGLAQTFPWLSGVADNYEEYAIDGMIFEYKTTSSNAVAATNNNPALGTVILATQYNSLSPVFTNKQQMENYEFGCSTNPSCSVMHAIECAPFLTPNHLLYIRDGSQNDISSGDLRLYDLGKFSIATVGCQAPDAVIGELWVTYKVKLVKSRLPSPDNLYAHYQINDTQPLSPGTNYFGDLDTIIRDEESTFNVTLTDTSIEIPSSFYGNVLAMYSLNGATGATGMQDPAWTASGNATAWNGFYYDSYPQLQSTYDYTAVDNLKTVFFATINGGGTLTLTGGVFPRLPAGGDIYIFALPPL